MDFSYLFFNTIIYGSLALMLSVFFSSGKMMNFALGNYLIVGAYILYSFFTHGFSRLTVGVLVAFICIYQLLHRLLLRYFPNDKQRELAGLGITLGLSVVLENAMNYLYGPSSISLTLGSGLTPAMRTTLFSLLFLLFFGACRYFFRKSIAGKMLNAINENSGLVRGFGISTTSFLQKVFASLLVLLFVLAFILLNETSLRASDGVFYMIKALGIMILVGTAKKERMFAGALVYVLVEYGLFILAGLPISYKETLVLVVILGVLLFKPEGLFSGKRRTI